MTGIYKRSWALIIITGLKHFGSMVGPNELLLLVSRGVTTAAALSSLLRSRWRLRKVGDGVRLRVARVFEISLRRRRILDL